MFLDNVGGVRAGLRDQVAREFDRGARVVGLLSGLAPNLPLHQLDHAFRALQFHPVVLGPDLTGACYLVGLQRPLPAFFEQLDWDPAPTVAQVLGAQTRPSAVHLLPLWPQLATAEGLGWWATHATYLASLHEDAPQHCATLLRERAAWEPPQ